MNEVGIRELKTRASEIVHQVQEEKARYVITQRGHPVAILIPVDEVSPVEGLESDAELTAWEELERLGQEISKNWKSAKTSTELLSEMRR